MIFNNLEINPGLPIMNNGEMLKTNNRTSLIVFIRHPEIDKVKTRLAATTSGDFALLFYSKCSSKLITELKNMPEIDKYLFYSERNEKYETKLPQGFSLAYQICGDLGFRMKNAFETVFNNGASKVIIAGTDVPDLNNEIVKKAENELEQNDIVIGPSNDGGYYLLGMKKMHGFLFENIEFGLSSVLSKTITPIKNEGLKYSLLPKLTDIDTEKDLLQWLNESSSSSIKDEIKLIYSRTKLKYE